MSKKKSHYELIPPVRQNVVAVPQKSPQKLYEISEGTVIDHIPAGQALRVLQVLGMFPETDRMVSLGMRLKSNKLDSKDIVKVEGKLLTKHELNKLALVAPGATINQISKGKVKEKFNVEVPQQFIGILQCQNPNCITRNQDIPTKFDTARQKPLRLRCCYCERLSDPSQMTMR